MKSNVSAHKCRKDYWVDGVLATMVIGSVLGLALIYLRQ